MTEEPIVTYPDNSRRARKTEPKERKRPEKVISGNVVPREKSFGRKLRETFAVTDTVSTRDFVIFDVIVPAIKNMFFDSTTRGLERALFFDDPQRRTTQGHRSSYEMYRPAERPLGSGFGRSAAPPTRGPNTQPYEIVLPTRGEAEDVLDAMASILAEYDVVTMADLYDLVGYHGTFTDNRWGWTNLRGIGVSRVRDGYLVNLPRPVSV